MQPSNSSHSPTGASTFVRWSNCGGYLKLAREAKPNEDEQPLYRQQGTVAHKIAEECLRTGKEAWEFSGKTIEGLKIGEGENDDVSPSDVQIYVDECRTFMSKDVRVWIEERIGDDPLTRPHPGFYGTVDFAVLGPDILRLRDLKFGEGVVVDVENNGQLKYYAYGLLLSLPELPDEMALELGIVQPRAPGVKPVRTWLTTVGEVRKWGKDVLVPAMYKADEDATFVPGEWCRFCPVKLRCPALKGMFRAAAIAATEKPETFTDEQLGQEFTMIPMIKMYLKAIEASTLFRALEGRRIPGVKLVKKKADRAWKDGAEAALTTKFGDLAMVAPKLKSPAQVEKISDAAKVLVSEWSYTPDTGLTVAIETDRRVGQNVPTAAETFSDFLNSGLEKDRKDEHS